MSAGHYKYYSNGLFGSTLTLSGAASRAPTKPARLSGAEGGPEMVVTCSAALGHAAQNANEFPTA